MRKPIFVLAPEKAREELRSSGVLPLGFLKAIDIERLAREGGSFLDDDSSNAPNVYLWPYQMPRSMEELSDVEEDAPGFYSYFGVNGKWNRDEKERIAAPLLHAVLVHVAFLAAGDENDGYVEFENLSGIEEWARNLKETLSSRFPNFLQDTEHVLILVARDGQLRVSQSEVETFSNCIGAHDGAFFKSCYFLDYNLHLDTPLCKSKDVWDIMVSKLLLAFALKLERVRNDTRNAPWNSHPGIKGWRTIDCRVVVNRDKLNPEVRGAVKAAFEQIRKNVGEFNVSKPNGGWDGDDNSDWGKIQDLAPDLQDGNDVEGVEVAANRDAQLHRGKEKGQSDKKNLYREWRDVEKKGWSDFEVDECVRMSMDNGCLPNGGQNKESRWAVGFRLIKRAFDAFLRKRHSIQAEGGEDSEIKSCFQRVHNSPDAVFAAETQLMEKICEDITRFKNSGDGSLHDDWSKICEKERERSDLVARIIAEQSELKLAMSHYVGWGWGLLVAMVVSIACGWLFYQLSNVLGGGLICSIVLSGSCTVGAFIAYLFLTYCHHRNGTNGAKALAQTSAKIDQAIVDRDKAARAIVKKGLDRARTLRLMGCHLAALSLISRLRHILCVEVQPETSIAVSDFEDVGMPVRGGDKDREIRRQSFLRQNEWGIVLNPSLDTDVKYREAIEGKINAWLSDRGEVDPPEGQKTFKELWQDLCKNDSKEFGYFPALQFAEGIRNFFRKYVSSVADMASRFALELEFIQAKNGLIQWVETITNRNNDWRFFSVQVTWKEVNESDVVPDLFIDNEEEFKSARNDFQEKFEAGGSVWKSASVIYSEFLKSIPTLALVYQECPIKLSRDAKTGVLCIAAVPDRG